MFLITSGAYIEREFVSELGLIPPSFLPLGNRCLYEYQVALAEQRAERICLSIPESFILSDYEQVYIDAHNIELIRVPAVSGLGESILYCLNHTAWREGALRILHGDTLFEELPLGSDLLSISTNTGYYQRAMLSADASTLLREQYAVDGEVVVSGYFSFSSAPLLRHCLEQQGQFIAALNAYQKQQPLTPVDAPDWYDFGHINAYFSSRAAFTTERSFNSLEISRSTVYKTSHKTEKILAEAHWFNSVPAEIQIYTPKLITAFTGAKIGCDTGDCPVPPAGYTLEYLYNLPLSDLFVFGRLDKETWRSIFQSCQLFLNSCQQAGVASPAPEPALMDHLYLPKTLARLEEYAATGAIDLDQPVVMNGKICLSPRELALHSSTWISPTTDADIAIIHGDFCFSNILYDFRTRRIKVIDPRGVDHLGQATIYGDSRYDYAKLYHSVYGLYDLIVAGRLRATRDASELHLRDDLVDYHRAINAVFDQVFFAGSPQLRSTIRAITIQLFLSMLPLHADRPERQLTMLANAYRLYADLTGETRCL